MLEQPIIRTRLGCILPCTLPLPILCLTRRLEEQTRALALLHHVRQIAPMRWITVVLDILSRRGIRQSVLVLVADLLHHGSHGLALFVVGSGL